MAGLSAPSSVRCATLRELTRGDVLIFATDGIRNDFADLLVPLGSCRDIAERVLHEHALGSDDALVLVARYLTRA
jgi:phosphoserine phosphatase RsbX